MADDKDTRELEDKAAEAAPTTMHRANVFGDGLWKGEKFALKLPAYLLDGLNDLPMLLNILPGVSEVGPFVGNKTYLYADYADEKLEALRGKYNNAVGYTEQEKVDVADHVLGFTGEMVGGGVVGAAEVNIAKKAMGVTEAAAQGMSSATASDTNAPKSFGKKVADDVSSLWERVSPWRVAGRKNVDLGDKIELLKDSPGPLKRLLAEARAKGFDSDTVDKINRLAREGRIPQNIADDVSAQFTKRFKGTGIGGIVDSTIEKVKASAGVLIADPLKASWLALKGTVTGAWETLKFGGKVADVATSKKALAVEVPALLYAHEHTDGASTKAIFKVARKVGETAVDAAPVALEVTATSIQKVSEFANSETGKALAEDVKTLATDTREGTKRIGGKVVKEAVRLTTDVAPGFIDTAQKELDPDGTLAKAADAIEEKTGVNPARLLTSTGRQLEVVKKIAGTAFNASSSSNNSSATSDSAPTAENDADDSSIFGGLKNMFTSAASGGVQGVKNKIKTAFNMLGSTSIGNWMLHDKGLGWLALGMTASLIIGKMTNPIFGMLALVGVMTEGPAALEKMTNMIVDATPPMAENKLVPKQPELAPAVS